MAVETAFLSEARFTQRQFRALLDKWPLSEAGHCELVRGTIVVTPPASARHGRLELHLATLLDSHVRRRRLGMVFGASTGYELPSGDTLQPDASYVSHERLEKGPRPKGEEFFRLVPDLVIEVLSRSTARRDRTEKRDIYAECGVLEYWLVDPWQREITLLHSQGDRFGDEERISRGRIPSRVLPGLRASIRDVFAPLDELMQRE